ncbi:uncharacterized protein LOC125525602 [Triticum urartu]|uniref:uncharacterized protein LOC125525602 n=1 Tax=Triticum urartu TaxID=4572 RepID=UPI002043426B|nr:uncharacterized protein LOC125525602 [Triticum urartu]
MAVMSRHIGGPPPAAVAETGNRPAESPQHDTVGKKADGGEVDNLSPVEDIQEEIDGLESSTVEMEQGSAQKSLSIEVDQAAAGTDKEETTAEVAEAAAAGVGSRSKNFDPLEGMIADKSECSGEELPGAATEATASRARGQGLTLADKTACGTSAGSASDAKRIEAPAKLEANPLITLVIAETGSESTESLKGVDNAEFFIQIDTDSHGMGLADMVETENGASLSTKSQPRVEQPPLPVPIVSHHRGTAQELMKVTSRVDAERKLKEIELSNIQKHTSDRDIGRGRQDTGTSNRTHFSHSSSGECSAQLLDHLGT